MTHPSKMLIADDDPFAVDYLELEDSGYTTVSASNGREALERVWSSTHLDRIHEAGGDINEAAGDGSMAIFQEAADVHAHAVTAVQDGTSRSRFVSFVLGLALGKGLAILLGTLSAWFS